MALDALIEQALLSRIFHDDVQWPESTAVKMIKNRQSVQSRMRRAIYNAVCLSRRNQATPDSQAAVRAGDLHFIFTGNYARQ